MTKDPAFLFYTSDFLTGTMTMTDDQVGKYIRLLCLQHQKGELSEKEILKVSGNDPEIIEKFAQQENGKFINNRLKKEVEKRKENAEKQRKKIQDYWDKKNKTEEEPQNNNGNTTVLPLENEDENVIENENEIQNELGKEKPLAMVKRIWVEAGLFSDNSDTKDLREVCEKILLVKDMGRISDEKLSELESTFSGIIKFIKKDGNVKYYGSFAAINKHLTKIVNSIKNGHNNGTGNTSLTGQRGIGPDSFKKSKP